MKNLENKLLVEARKKITETTQGQATGFLSEIEHWMSKMKHSCKFLKQWPWLLPEAACVAVVSFPRKRNK